MSGVQEELVVVRSPEFKPVEIKGPTRKSIAEMIRDKPGFKHEPGKLDHMLVPTPKEEK